MWIFIPLSKYHIEVNENDTLLQSFQVSDNVKLKNLIIEYSNIPRQFNQVANIDLNLNLNQKIQNL